MKKVPDKLLTKDEIKSATEYLKQYIDENFDIEAGNLACEMFLDYISEKIGIMYYNKGVSDSMQMIKEKADDLYLLMKD